MDGVEQRKALAELVTFGCTEGIEGIYRAFVHDSKPVTIDGRSFQLRQVHFVALTEVPGTKEPIPVLDLITAEGWVLDNALVRISDDDLKSLLKGRDEKHEKTP